MVGARLERERQGAFRRFRVTDLREGPTPYDFELDPFARVLHAREPGFQKDGERLPIGGCDVNGLEAGEDVAVGDVDLSGALEGLPASRGFLPPIEPDDSCLV